MNNNRNTKPTAIDAETLHKNLTELDRRVFERLAEIWKQVCNKVFSPEAIAAERERIAKAGVEKIPQETPPTDAQE